MSVDAMSEMKVVDVDSHFTEPSDLWTSRVSSKDRDRVPRKVRDDDGRDTWYFDGDRIFARPAGASSVIRLDGSKQSFWDWNIQAGLQWDEVHPGAYDVGARLDILDKMGIWAQIVYPNTAGFGANKLAKLEDRALATLIVETYNTAVSELQEESGDRLFPMALVPFWDLEAMIKEVSRACGDLGLRGITMCSEPHAGDLPALPDPHWNPLWEICTELGAVVNFHVGASDFGMDAFLSGTWPGQDRARQLVVGSALIELHNARVMANLLTSDLLERYPEIKWVSVESGIGWVPYLLERLEYQLLESTPDGKTIKSPTEAFREHAYACFWFEEIAPMRLLDHIGFDNVLFETDYPHPTCLYPDPVEHAKRVLAPWGDEVVRKVMSENAIKLYRLPA